LYGTMIVNTRKNPPPIEFVLGRLIIETRGLFYEPTNVMEIHIPSYVVANWFSFFNRMNMVKQVSSRKSKVLRVLVLVEVLPPDDNDPDVLRKLAEYYEEEAARYREMFKCSKIKDIFRQRIDVSWSRDRKMLEDIFSRL